jgi:uncharacterized protein (DUF1810 family)
MVMPDPFDLARFVKAQDPVFVQVRDELRQGRKRSHWMWYIFPQIAGLGHSDMARRYAVSFVAEAQAYLAHPVLGARLIEATGLVCAVQGRSITDILGPPDDMKFGSCMTLFHKADPSVPVFTEALAKYFGGKLDAATLRKLEPTPPSLQ